MINEILPQIKDVSQRSSWEQAAKQWRLPFWDWAIPQADTKALGLPRIASQEQFSILKLDGTGTEAIVNPMQKYTNRVTDNGQLKEVPMGDSKMGAYQITYNVHDKIDKKIELDVGSPTLNTTGCCAVLTILYSSANRRVRAALPIRRTSKNGPMDTRDPNWSTTLCRIPIGDGRTVRS